MQQTSKQRKIMIFSQGHRWFECWLRTPVKTGKQNKWNVPMLPGLCNNSKPNTLLQNMKMQLMEDEPKSPCFFVWAVFVMEMGHTRKQHVECFSPSLWWKITWFKPNILSVYNENRNTWRRFWKRDCPKLLFIIKYQMKAIFESAVPNKNRMKLEKLYQHVHFCKTVLSRGNFQIWII